MRISEFVARRSLTSGYKIEFLLEGSLLCVAICLVIWRNTINHTMFDLEVSDDASYLNGKYQ